MDPLKQTPTGFENLTAEVYANKLILAKPHEKMSSIDIREHVENNSGKADDSDFVEYRCAVNTAYDKILDMKKSQQIAEVQAKVDSAWRKY